MTNLHRGTSLLYPVKRAMILVGAMVQGYRSSCDGEGVRDGVHDGP